MRVEDLNTDPPVELARYFLREAHQDTRDTARSRDHKGVKLSRYGFILTKIGKAIEHLDVADSSDPRLEKFSGDLLRHVLQQIYWLFESTRPAEVEEPRQETALPGRRLGQTDNIETEVLQAHAEIDSAWE